MFETQRVEIEWGGRKLSLETGRMARQADAAVLAQYGETSVLATVVAEKSAATRHRLLSAHRQLPGEDLTPPARSPAAISSARAVPTEKETLTSRLIDRPIRPLFVEGFKHETQVVVTVLSHDMENDPDIVAMVAASRGADAVGRAVPRPDRRRPRRRHRRRVRAQPHDRRDGEERARPGRGRHRRRRDDGGIGGQGAAREADARGRHVRPPRLPAGDRRHHQAGREGAPRSRGTSSRPTSPSTSTRSRRWSEADLRKAFATPEKQKRHELIEAASAKVKKELLPADADASEQVLLGSVFKGLEQDVVRGDIITTQASASTAAICKTVRPIRLRGARAAAHARLGAVHPRRDAGPRRRHARHRRGRAVHRRAGGHAQGALPAALQLPALLGGRDRPHGLARPARDRPRQARLARRASADADARGISLHGARGLRDHRIQRLLVDGVRVRRLAGADGCRRAAEAPRCRHRHGPHQGGQQLRRALRHPGRRGPPGRHGLQGGRHREGRHLAADGHQDHRHHRGDHARRRWSRPTPAACTSWARWARPSRAPAPSSASTRRASRPSRSRSTRSAR